MNQVEAMHIYARVAELGSFTKAADSIGLPKASISAAVKQLETMVGTRLLQRTTRKVQMTHDGQAFYERSKNLLADMEELQTMFQQSDADMSGRLRVDMPAGLARNAVIPKLPSFLEQHPRLEVELSSTDRRVDVVSEGFDCVIRVGQLDDSGLIARPLGQLRQLNCASPAYLARYGTPQTLNDLDHHHLIHYVRSLGNKSPGFEYVEDGKLHTRSMRGSVTVNNSDAYSAACLAGLGIIQVPEIGARESIAQGLLMEVLSDHQAAPMPVSLLYPHRQHVPKRTQRFMLWVAEVIRDYV